LLLAPLGWLVCAGALGRRWLYRRGPRRPERVGVPVVVVGNVTVGGTGKTPLVIWLAERLRETGLRPAVLVRGYRGRAREWPQRVTPESDPDQVGDEAVLIARRSGCPVYAGPDRVAAGRAARAQTGCDVLISDDGLQAPSLGRDVEIAVLDGERRLGNGRCLPAGPLREPAGRLRSVDLVVVRGAPGPGEHGMRYRGERLLPVGDEARALDPRELAHEPVHGVAGIGNPSAFFAQLRSLGLRVIEHPFPDHHRFGPQDLDFGDHLPVVMTEKDAVKCRGLRPERAWYLPVTAELDGAFAARLLALLEEVKRDGQEAARHPGLSGLQGAPRVSEGPRGAHLLRLPAGLPDSRPDPGHAGGGGAPARARGVEAVTRISRGQRGAPRPAPA
jgi:tetraacyldisaccharide 4'-kinase